MRWAGAAIEPDDPALPEGVEPLRQHVHAPAELARRLAQIGVVDRADAPRFVQLLKPGQRLVSREGDLWRWDGFSVAADAPTGAARRLAGKNRLADIEAELQAVRAEVEAKRAAAEAAEAEVRAAAEAETDARARWRETQRAAAAAREQHANAEREASREAARSSALTEAKSRLAASRDEAGAALGETEQGLASLAPVADIETQLAPCAARSKPIASSSPRCAPRRRRSRARPSWRRAAWRRSAPSARAGSPRQDSAASQLATLDQRVEEATAERAEPRRRPGRLRREAHAR